MVARVRRGLMQTLIEGISVHIEPPGIEWDKVIGTDKIGAGFGLHIRNILDLKLGNILYCPLSYDIAFGSELTPYNKIDTPLVDYRFLGNVMTSITVQRCVHNDNSITFHGKNEISKDS